MLKQCFFHFRTREPLLGEAKDWQIKSRGGVTVCVTADPLELDTFRVMATSAICSLDDGYDKSEGRTKSAGRMVSLKTRYGAEGAGTFELPKKQFALVKFIEIDDSLAQVAKEAARLAIDKLDLRSKTEEEMVAIREELWLGVERTLLAWAKAKEEASAKAEKAIETLEKL